MTETSLPDAGNPWTEDTIPPDFIEAGQDPTILAAKRRAADYDPYTFLLFETRNDILNAGKVESGKLAPLDDDTRFRLLNGVNREIQRRYHERDRS